MKLIATIDDRIGVLFNHRRQSRDSAVMADIINTVMGTHLWVSPYTAQLFDEDACPSLCVDDGAVDHARPGEFYFAENGGFPPNEANIEQIVLYRWNRAYPSDVKFPLDLSAPEWELVSTGDIKGISHPKITKEVYKHVSQKNQ